MKAAFKKSYDFHATTPQPKKFIFEPRRDNGLGAGP
jgi:hypothetical protein